MKSYWGDLHNHCAVSYGHGTVARALDNARQHLDFCTITGHAFWPDMPMDLAAQNGIIGMHLGGFAKLQYYWPELMRQLKAANQPGEFVTLPSYEWHSMKYGDHNCYAPAFDLSLQDAPNLPALTRKVSRRHREFMLLPHHCGYTRGQRGTNWAEFDAARSPLVEIYSNHGSSESDDAPYDYYHSMGPRVGESLMRTGLQAGHRFGFIASTDSHDGYPGHYGHGCVGVFADRLDQASIWSALKSRRTIASTGARIRIVAQLNGTGLGGVTDRKDGAQLGIEIEGTAPIQSVDLVEGDATGCRVRRLAGNDINSRFTPGRHKIKVECGWGRSQAVSEWQIDHRVIGGRLLGCQPCFRHSKYPMDEATSTERILAQDGKQVSWTCRAVPNPAGMMGGTHFNASGTQAMILEIEGGAKTRLQTKSGSLRFDVPLPELAGSSVGGQVAGFGSAALKVHRAVPEREFVFRHEENYTPHFTDEGTGFVYVRVVQSDGHSAWASPIWWE
jgi:hypothetical protein